jgi:hypothetical protein
MGVRAGMVGQDLANNKYPVVSQTVEVHKDSFMIWFMIF